jgi:peptide/nickel transport system ATP-binding protein
VTAPVLEIDGLHTHFFTRDGVVRAVEGLSLTVQPGELLGVVGESGCGKSVTALSTMRLIPERSGRVVRGAIRFEGQDLAGLSEAQMRRIRGNRIAMVFQEPMTSLNPVHTIGQQIAEAVRIHQGLDRRAARARALEVLREVRIPDPERRLDSYPHEFSGGMRQRVMIAMALSCEPRLLIADEPTTALDVTIQAQILTLMVELQRRSGAAVLLITHDLGVIAETAQRVVVMYAGRKVEEAAVEPLFDRPLHPYTRGLMASIPRGRQGARQSRLTEIPGIVPSLREPAPGVAPLQGCAFAERCGLADARCRSHTPVLRPFTPDGQALADGASAAMPAEAVAELAASAAANGTPVRWVACWHAESAGSA